jgi:hypothetical protein
MLLSSCDIFPHLIQKRRSQLGFVTYLLNCPRIWLCRPCWLCCLCCKYETVSPRELGYEPRLAHRHSSFVFSCVVLLAVSATSLVTRSEESYRVCLCLTVCHLGTSTNSRSSLQFACSTTERK